MGLKSKIAYRELNSRLSAVTREKKVVNLDSAESAGVLWEIDQQDSFDRLTAELRIAGLQVESLCYFQNKNAVIPDHVKGFTRKMTNWYEIPKTELVERFINQKYDILIDLSGQQFFPLVYITALSAAAFKIGYSGSAVNYFDLSINFSSQPDSRQLAEQILYYLKRINKTTIE